MRYNIFENEQQEEIGQKRKNVLLGVSGDLKMVSSCSNVRLCGSLMSLTPQFRSVHMLFGREEESSRTQGRKRVSDRKPKLAHHAQNKSSTTIGPK